MNRGPDYASVCDGPVWVCGHRERARANADTFRSDPMVRTLHTHAGFVAVRMPCEIPTGYFCTNC